MTQRLANTLTAVAAVVALLALAASPQASNLVKPRLAGEALASQFGLWQMTADGPILGTGQPETAWLVSGAFTLPDGTAFQPLAVGTPVAIGGDAHPETVTPTQVNCGVGSGACSFQAVFAYPHAGHFSVSSGTAGLQEAINYQAQAGGGVVVVDSDFRGSLAGLLSQLQLPDSVLLLNDTAGQWAMYGLGHGGAPEQIGGYSSASGALTGPLASLNGAVFASAHNFSTVTPGGTLTAGQAATVTPAWTLPAGVMAGDTLYISGGTGTAEAVTVTNVGTGCTGGGANSVCFTPANAHSGAWTLTSATQGLQEAVDTAAAGGWVIDDIPNATLHAPLVVSQTVRLTGFSAMDASIGTQIVQAAPNTDTIQIGRASVAPSDVVLEDLMAVGVSGAGSDAGVAIHCVNCAKLKLTNVTAKQAHDGLYFDSSNGHAYDATVIASHFIDNYYGVHIVGGSANRLTFTGNTVDSNVYGVFDDGGWVHTWVGNDIEDNSEYGYWQQVSNPASYSGHNVVLDGNYFENNGAAAGQGDVFLGQLVGGGTGNNGDGCNGCEVTDNLFNAASGGAVTALSLGSSNLTVSDNTYSGYGTGKIYAYATGPAPNYSHVLSLGDGGNDTGATAGSGAYGGSRAGTVTRIDNNGGLTLGGWDQLNNTQGSPILDTTIESPTGNVSVRGVPGGETSSNPASLYLDGNSSSQEGNSIFWRNASVNLWQINNDPFGNGSHDFCLMQDLANPSAARCIAYINPQDKWLFSPAGPSGSLATRTQDYQFTQVANGDSALVVNRSTNTSPSGYLIDLEDATLSTPLFRIDTTGTVVAGNWNNSTSAMTVGPLAATTGTFSGTVTAPNFGAVTATTGTFSGTLAANGGLTVGGAAVSATVSGQSGTGWNGTYTAGECITGGISFSSGVAIGMAVASNPETAPPAGLMWNAYIDTVDHVTVRVCNVTASSITWSSGSIWDVRVLP